jgi:hypothetical protein
MCEWCDQLAKRYRMAEVIPFRDWQPSQGLRTLFEMCAPSLLKDVPTINTDRQMRDLLSLVQRRSAMSSVPLGCSPLAGLLPGMLLANVVAIGLIWIAALRLLTAWLVGIAAGIILGLAVGALVSAVYSGRRFAREKIAEAYFKYDLDPERLDAAAQPHCRRIRVATGKLLTSLAKR